MSPLAAQRDASWWNRPNTRSPKKFHIVAPDTGGLCVGGVSRCGVVLDETSAVSAEEIAPVCRCNRRACATRWP